MSIEELRACIDQLSADILLQKEVLNQLEQSKSTAQRQLNAICDPMARLPLEISSEIFLECLPETPRSDVHAAPMLLLNICNAWNDLARSIPTLWTTVSLEPPAGAQILEAWLRRAQNYSLSISLHNTLDDDISAVLGQYTQQLKHLKISGDKDRVNYDSLTDSFPQLETLTIEIVQPEGEEDWISIDIAPVMRILRHAPNLVHCNMHGIFADRYLDMEVLILPRLLSLEFGDEAGQADVLRYLSLPALQTLSVQFTHIYDNDLLLFLKRSLPPLQKLSVGSDITNSQAFTELQKCLELLPSLAHLELHCHWFEAAEHLIEGLFSALADYPSHFLPNLRTLNIRCHSPPLSSSTYQAVYRGLAARHPQLVSVDITGSKPGRSRSGLEENVRDGLRQLVADGMDIYIGDPSCNFI